MSRIGRLGGRSSAGRRQASRPEGGFPGTDGGEGNANSPNGGEPGGPDRVAGQADEMAEEDTRA
jgi:hypothetical protein